MSSLSVGHAERNKSGSEFTETKQEVRFVRVKSRKRKPRLKPPTAIERIFGKSTAVKDRYFTAGSNINESNLRNVHTEVSPFKYPEDLEDFSYRVMSKAWRDDKRRMDATLPFNKRQSYRTKQKIDLLNRLWVKDPEIKSMKTILDIDPNYFNIIEGRQALDNFTHKEYIQDVRDILRTKIVTGYREDDIMLIEENFIIEQKVLDEIKAEFQKYVNTFEEFLFNDHTTSMHLLEESEIKANLAGEKYDTFRDLSKQYGSLKSIVYNLEEKWRNCKMYQKFLYLVSPMEWRKHHDFYHIKRKISQKSVELEEENSGSAIFARYKLGATGEVLSLTNLIEQFLDDINFQREPELYFTHPVQLLKVFAFIEIQNLNSLLHSEELAIPLENVTEGMRNLNLKFNNDMVFLQDIIDSLEVGIVWEEQRAAYLEELAHELIAGEFKALISNENVISLYVFVEDVYETRIAPNDSNIPMSEMMTLIELKYRDYLLQLDRLPSSLVYRAEMDCYIEEAKIMAIAKDAAKKVLQVERLMKHLTRLLEPPVHRTQRELKWRAAPPEKLKKRTSQQKQLSPEECDYLTYFVDFSAHNDDPKKIIRMRKTKDEISRKSNVQD